MAAAEQAKEAAGRAAAALVERGMRIGLGTGSTVYWSIVALGERAADLDLVCVATSARTAELAGRLGLRLEPPDAVRHLDITIDGADEVDPQGNLTKGGGGAHTRERIVAAMADRFVVVVDESKLVERLGPFGTPIEVLPFAPLVATDALQALGAGEVEQLPERSDNGNVLLRARFDPIEAPGALAAALAQVPGVVDHGIFLAGMVDRCLVAGAGGVHVVEVARP